MGGGGSRKELKGGFNFHRTITEQIRLLSKKSARIGTYLLHRLELSSLSIGNKIDRSGRII